MGMLVDVVEVRHVRLAYGAGLLIGTRPVLSLIGTADPDQRLLCAARFLGARQLAEGLLPGRAQPLLLAVDAVHASSMFAFADWDPARRRPAVASLVVTSALAAAALLTRTPERG
jgi:hypothetical protein